MTEKGYDNDMMLAFFSNVRSLGKQLLQLFNDSWVMRGIIIAF
jgi:hypothetical protein